MHHLSNYFALYRIAREGYSNKTFNGYLERTKTIFPAYTAKFMPRQNMTVTTHFSARPKTGTRFLKSNGADWTSRNQPIFTSWREDVWNLHIGGYQVCEKWLKDRKGRTVTADNRTHYQKIIIALSETIRLMTEIDAVIAKHGGWPLK